MDNTSVDVVLMEKIPITNSNSTGYLFSGSCRLIHKNACFFTLDVFQLVFDASAFAIPATLYYKYSKVTSLNSKDLSRNRVRLILFSSYFLSIVVGVIYVITYSPDESLAVESETRKQFSREYDFTHYAGITGYVNHFWSSLTNNLNMLSVYIPPIMSLIFIRMIQIRLRSFKHLFTDKTAAQARKFDLALTIQTLVPAVCVIPVYTAHIILEHYIVSFMADFEKVLYMMLALPTAIDAFIVIITITPYRRSFLAFFEKLFGWEKPPPPAFKLVHNSRATSLF
ncbi:CRE-SRD-34 protein [Caenorhabditis remanei]|uniref:CRE-SRD-34 protein n=1 Tax=Caenorhabditis remanei TaxID=31234 RepID=E3MQU4_CAERE|nr:CRE-SRD-34 protein [Caenorhabditis remanei]